MERHYHAMKTLLTACEANLFQASCFFPLEKKDKKWWRIFPIEKHPMQNLQFGNPSLKLLEYLGIGGRSRPPLHIALGDGVILHYPADSNAESMQIPADRFTGKLHPMMNFTKIISGWLS